MDVSESIEHALDPRYVPMQREVGWIVAAVVSVVLLVGLFALLTPRRWLWCLALWIVGTIAVAWFSYGWPPVEYRHTSFRLDENGIEICMGVFWRRVMNVPKSRVQHTDVAQGPFERRYGLGRLVIYTAGTDHSRVELPGLAHEHALQIRDQLLPRERGDAV